MPPSDGYTWRDALGRSGGREYWRGLEELLETPEFLAELHREFPAGADQLAGGMSRRTFVHLLGASMALAGLSGCFRRPREPILPYVQQPEGLIPGEPLHFATAMMLDGYATGLLVESHAGRPTKIEGNPDHPASLGAAGVYQQASLLQLYDPHRARRMTRQGRAVAPASLWRRLEPAAVAARAGSRGAGLHIILEPTSSPLAGAMLARVRERFPAAGIHWHAPTADRVGLGDTAAAFGRPLQPIYRPDAADVMVLFQADLMGTGPFYLRYARQFAEARRLTGPDGRMSRLYAVEARPTVSGSLADHRLPVRPSRMPALLLALYHQLVPTDGAPAVAVTPDERAWLSALAADLQAHRGAALVVAGDELPRSARVLAHLITAALDGVGRVVHYVDPALVGGGEPSGLESLAAAIGGGQVETLLVLNANPVYTAPPELEFARALARVPDSIHLGLFRNETGAACRWQVPARHYLEAWGDGRALNGTAGLIQPLIAPLYQGASQTELLARLAGESAPDPHALLQEQWRATAHSGEFPAFWEEALHRGVIAGTESPSVAVAARPPAPETIAPPLPDDTAVDLILGADARVHDGRFADNPWLQELPDPLTKLTWDNAAVISPGMAARLGVETEQLLRITAGGRELVAPALVLPGQADGTVALALGYGRRAPDEPIARGVGFDAYPLLPRDGFVVTGAEVRPAGGRHELARTQTHWSMEGRPVVLAATLAEYRADPGFAREERGPVLSLYQPFAYRGEQWGMAIDLGLCTGCSGCVVACQAENNIPVVGKEGVRDSREMHWLRIDRYYSGHPAAPEVVTQPMLCQHCEQAPCEYVCPVNATVHSPDGLNEMIYNRCVGTRFCSNNCPYKVRRFNWFDYNAEIAETVAMAHNPEVTVRARGVMEKCTFCIQRIRNAQIEAAVAGRPLGGDAVRTACQQACPTQAIVFGSLGDPDSSVVQRLREPRSYQVLHELGTRPRVHYLARIRNPNPALEERGAE